jgi:nitrite reductase/ring-hydroxylating ferredoxin subunit
MCPLRVIDLSGALAKDGTFVAIDSMGKEWLVSIENGSLRIFFNECPHQGQPLKASNSKFVCTGHNWTFGINGENFVKNGQCLKEFKDFHVAADKCVINWTETPRQKTSGTIPVDLSLTFFSHACIGLSANNFSLLTDPWLENSTYDGNWVHWPAMREIQSAQPDVIVITHEHPDHFHDKSLLRFPSDTLIVVPNYLNRNLFQKVKNLGFKNVVSLNYNETYQVVEGVRIQFLRPSSKWEDSILDLDFFGFKWLNVNDAGYVSSEEWLSSNYHLLTATFDVFASDYPMMWQNIDERKKVRHIEESKKSALNHIVRLSKLANSKYFLPFASFWRLNPSKFADLELKMNHLTLDEIHDFFKLSKSESVVLDVLPGESFSFNRDDLLSARPNREMVKSGIYPIEAVEIDSINDCDGSLCQDMIKDTAEFLQEMSLYSEFFRSEDVNLQIMCNCGSLIAKQFFRKVV